MKIKDILPAGMTILLSFAAAVFLFTYVLSEPEEGYIAVPVFAPAASPAPLPIPTPAPTPTPAPIRVRFMQVHGLLQDFSQDVLDTVEFVESTHVNFLVDGRMCMELYEQYRAAYIAATRNPMSHTDFVLATQHFLTVFNDGHLSRSFLQGFWVLVNNVWDWQIRLFQDGEFLEHQLLSRYGRLFLADDNMVKTDVEVLAIGGIPVPEIFATIDHYFGTYNEAGRQRNRGRYARYSLMLHRAGATLYQLGGNLLVDVTLLENGTQRTVEMGFVDLHPAYRRIPTFEPEYHVRWELLDGDIFYVNLNHMAPSPQWEAAATAISHALESGVRDFILDLRNNAGGNPAIGHALLQAMGVSPATHGMILRLHAPYYHLPAIREVAHLTLADLEGRSYIYIPRDPASANPYGVRVIALTSERTFSGGATIALEVADSCFGLIIGEPPSTSPSWYGWGGSIYLNTSHVQIRPHGGFYLRPNINECPLTLYPDIHTYEWLALEAALDFLRSTLHNPK
ncbi:MAG: S41 family peptidase [Defluviitaleaceae bacterium]|nr:S41 family peptidase [Defluviitaleaceae bacterium]MCL2274813.1 S41 family peptidase [Defluviitaleaceae bacterium]